MLIVSMSKVSSALAKSNGDFNPKSKAFIDIQLGICHHNGLHLPDRNDNG
jgi:hypothetical protein